MILKKLQAKGIRLWVEQGKLKYQAPSGIFTEAEKQYIIPL